MFLSWNIFLERAGLPLYYITLYYIALYYTTGASSGPVCPMQVRVLSSVIQIAERGTAMTKYSKWQYLAVLCVCHQYNTGMEQFCQALSDSHISVSSRFGRAPVKQISHFAALAAPRLSSGHGFTVRVHSESKLKNELLYSVKCTPSYLRWTFRPWDQTRGWSSSQHQTNIWNMHST